MYAHAGGDPGEDEVPESRAAQDQFEIGRVASALFRSIVSPGSGDSRGMICHPASRALGMRPFGPGSPTPAPMQRLRRCLLAGKSAKCARWSSRVCRMRHPRRSRGHQSFAYRLGRGARERDVVAHPVELSALTAKIELHIDYEQCRVCRVACRRRRESVGIAFDYQARVPCGKAAAATLAIRERMVSRVQKSLTTNANGFVTHPKRKSAPNPTQPLNQASAARIAMNQSASVEPR